MNSVYRNLSNNSNLNPSFASGDKSAIRKVMDERLIIMPGTNRDELAGAVDKFTKTLVKGEIGDVPTLEKLEDANCVLDLARKLQELGAELFNNAKKGVEAVRQRPFNEEHPKRT